MVKVKPGAPRAEVTDTADGLEIRIRPRRLGYAILSAILWLSFLSVFSLLIYGALLKPGLRHADPLPVLLMTMPLLGLCLLMFTWLPLAVEVIRMNGRELIRSRKLFGIGRSSEYALADIKNLRVAPLPVIPNLTDSRGNPGLMLHIGLIAFDYGYKTCRIGHGLEEPEARELVQRISTRFPSLSQK
ncbi:MAG TPA: hypothetical protein VGV16_00545 [Gammaproteobacteria bacterium]|nr:hypothetical protein [Gammaproteobacteria bacterium]